MPGVNILVRGTSIGAIADAQGMYTITVPDANATLVFSFIGYVSQEVPLSGRTTLDVVLAADMTALEEVVVTGYGTTKRASLTGSVSAVSGDNLKQSPTTNITNSLVGRLPGLTAIQKSGEPGYDNTTIYIRGANTLGNNAPLIVIDGIPNRSMERLDPADIESFTILKDASAAIYGTQAANGVILITTKRGKIGKPTITFNANYGFNQPTVIPDMADAETYATMLNEIAYYSNPSGGRNQQYSDAELQKFADGSDPWGYPNTDWFKEVFKPWSQQDYENISVSGGTESMKYFLSLGHKFQDAYYYNSATNYSQYDFRSNIDGKVSKNISIAFDVSGRQENKNFPTVGAGDIFRMLMRGKPDMPAYWPSGEPGPDIEYGFNPAVTVTDQTGTSNDKIYYLESNVRLDVKIPWVKGLSVQANGSYDKVFRFQKVFRTPWYLYTWDGNASHTLAKGKRGLDAPELTENFRDGHKGTYNIFATYENSLGGTHNIKVIIGTERQSALNNYLNAFRKNFVTSAIPQLFAGAADTYMTNNGWADQNARESYFAKINYDLKQKYLVELVMRYDGSYMFKPGKQFGFFPGVSLGWRISDETFWQNSLSFINDFKLRASWGQTGNDRIYYGGSLKEYQFLSTYSFDSQNYVFGQSVNAKMLSENVVPNPDVTWEIANQSNLGFNLTTLNNKLSVEGDIFYNLRSRILWQASAVIPTSTGMTLPPQNIGKVSNIGFEYTITYRGITGDFGYDLSLNGSYAKNKIVFTFDTPGIPEYQKAEGMPMGADLNYVAIGVFDDTEDVASNPHWAGAQPGDIIFKDVNDDGVIDGLDRMRDSKTDMPRYIGGFNANLSYKQFDLSMLFQGAAGAINYLGVESGDIGNFYQRFAENRWTPENTGATWPRAWNRDNEYWRNRGNTFWQFSTDYLRLKNMEVGYTLPKSVSSKLGIEQFRIYFSGLNLITLDKIKLIDPELDSGQSYPLQRVVNLGLTLTF
ncbi:MAG: SusC/RagA family TonB-linked outer membrane protein [Bacteroidetes bacterium RBG_13_43_22]|nr:MAG: SusC/RagA family TonB-linked outer membrane protein [Bacteroidetes bacterium RBG_13_43_22]